MARKEALFQLIWGIALTCAGVGMFLKIPQKMTEIRQDFSSGIFFFHFGLYMISVLLIVGGGKKIYNHFFGMKRKE